MVSIYVWRCVVLVAMLSVSCVHADEARFALARGSEPACKVVTMSAAKPAILTTRAGELVRETAKRWSGIDVPVTALKAGDRLPDGSAVVLATLDALRKSVPSLEASSIEIGRVDCIDEQGFAIAQVDGKVFVVSKTPRGVYNGAVYLTDFLMDGPKSALSISGLPVVRSPQMPGRASYHLTIWGNEAQYSASDWEGAIDSYARDGFDRVYFWVSGHFPSKKYPQTYKCRDNGWDTTEKSRIGAIKDLRAIMKRSQEMGLKYYLGGALGGWVGTMHLTNMQPGTMKTGEGIAPMSLCPSHPASRKALIEYYKEVFDAFPEADGVYIEMADEWGECRCDTCGKPVDGLGSRQFGQSQLTLVQEIAREIWRDHPHARFALTIGYAEHKNDPAFYEVVRQMSDPRFEWMEARNSWEWPGPDGKPLPASYFTRQVMHWSQHYNLPLDHIVEDANRIAKSGYYGLATAYEPGAGTGSFYREIPFPVDVLPYALTGFVFREATWDPAISVEEMRSRVRRKFFGNDAPEQLGKDLWAMRELIRTASGAGKLSDAEKALLSEIEGRIREAEPTASPKTLEGIALLKRAVKDTRERLGGAARPN